METGLDALNEGRVADAERLFRASLQVSRALCARLTR